MVREIRISINEEVCQICQPCDAASVCTVRAIVKIDVDEAPYIDIGRCYDCRLCLPACPFNAVIIRPLA